MIVRNRSREPRVQTAHIGAVEAIGFVFEVFEEKGLAASKHGQLTRDAAEGVPQCRAARDGDHAVEQRIDLGTGTGPDTPGRRRRWTVGLAIRIDRDVKVMMLHRVAISRGGRIKAQCNIAAGCCALDKALAAQSGQRLANRRGRHPQSPRLFEHDDGSAAGEFAGLNAIANRREREGERVAIAGHDPGPGNRLSGVRGAGTIIVVETLDSVCEKDWREARDPFGRNPQYCCGAGLKVVQEAEKALLAWIDPYQQTTHLGWRKARR